MKTQGAYRPRRIMLQCPGPGQGRGYPCPGPGQEWGEGVPVPWSWPGVGGGTRVLVRLRLGRTPILGPDWSTTLPPRKGPGIRDQGVPLSTERT